MRYQARKSSLAVKSGLWEASRVEKEKKKTHKVICSYHKTPVFSGSWWREGQVSGSVWLSAGDRSGQQTPCWQARMWPLCNSLC